MKTFRKISPRRISKLLRNYSSIVSRQYRIISQISLDNDVYRARICELERINKLYKYVSLLLGVFAVILGLIFQFV